MAHRIRPIPYASAAKVTAPIESKPYLAWLHELPCLITLSMPVQAAHLSKASPGYGHLGRGKGRKASDRWALPLSNRMHDMQHASGDEMKFWRRHGINPYLAALSLHGLWTDLKDEATPIAVRMITTRVIGRVN